MIKSGGTSRQNIRAKQMEREEEKESNTARAQEIEKEDMTKSICVGVARAF